MAIFRTPQESKFQIHKGSSLSRPDEWTQDDDKARLDEPAWDARYKHEATILEKIISDNNYTNIIELGSGPGVLSQMVIEMHDKTLDYTLIDLIGAKEVFDERNYKGRFIVKDMLNDFDISDLDASYDFLVTNDFLEHINNPTLIVQNCYKIIKDGGKMFVSVPNWRMGHKFIYRGLFDYDNFIYFMYIHGFNISGIYKSNLECPTIPKLSSEDEIDPALINSWNWYMLFDKV